MAKFPWVSRVAYDALRDQVAQQTATLEAERDRYTALVGEMLVMQRAGFTPPAPTPAAPGPDPNRLPPDVEFAISQHMAPEGVAGRQTAKQARLWLAANVPIDEVIARIHQGAG